MRRCVVTPQSVHYDLRDGIATIRLDDGKRNALSPAMFGEIYASLERVERERAALVITGRPDVSRQASISGS